MLIDTLIARQPIPDLSQRVRAYELLYRPVSGSERIDDPDRATAHLPAGVFGDVDRVDPLRGLPGYVNITHNLLVEGASSLFPPAGWGGGARRDPGRTGGVAGDGSSPGTRLFDGGGRLHEDPAASFTVGAFSMLDVVTHLPIWEAVKRLPLAVLLEALVDHRGIQGELLDVAVAYERANWDELGDLGVAASRVSECYLAALDWAGALADPRKAA